MVNRTLIVNRVHKVLILFTCIYLVSNGAYTQVVMAEHKLSGTQTNQPDLIPRSVIFSDETNRDVRLSSDGHYILYTHTDGSSQSTMLKDYLTHEAVNLSALGNFSKPFLSNHASVLFLENSESNKLFRYDIKNDVCHSITLNVRYDKGGFYGQSPLDDENVLAFLKQGDVYNFYKINILTGHSEFVEQVKYSKYIFDENLNFTAAEGRNQNGGVSYYIKKNDNWVEFLAHPWDEGLLLGRSLNSLISFDVVKKLIYFTSHFESDKVQLYAYDAHRSAPELQHEDTRYDVTDRAAFIGKNGALRAIKNLYAQTTWTVFDHTIKQDFEFLRNNLHENFEVLDSSIDDDIWLVKVMKGAPADYYIYYRPIGRFKKILCEKPTLSAFSFAKRKTFQFTTEDGMRFPVQAYFPKSATIGNENKPYPTVVYVHGGPWVANFWDSWSTNRHLQLLADRGYLVLVPDFRGSLGYGKKVVEASAKQWGKDMHRDIRDAVNWGIAVNYIDPERLTIFGWSYGGYEALFALSNMENPVFRCAIAQFGPSDLYGFLQSELGKQPLWKYGLGDIEKEEEQLKAVSPYYLAHTYQSPVLVSHGQLDALVPIAQTNRFVKKLREKNKEVDYISFFNEGHDYVHAENHESFWALAEQFLQKHLGGRAQPIGSELKNKNIRSLIQADS